MDSLTAQELKAVKEVKELAEEYGWKDDHHEFKDMLKQVRKKFKKEAGKMNKSTAQEDADEKKPTIKSFDQVVGARGGADHQGLRSGEETDDPLHPKGRVGV